MKMGVNSSRLTMAFILGTALFLSVGAKQVSFPGSKSETKSPDGRFTIRNLDNDHGQPAHSLVLTDSNSGKQRVMYEYGRHVDVLWSPGSNALIVNDYGGSDFTRTILLILPAGKKQGSLWGEMIHFLRSRGEARLALENGHVYLTAEKWLNDHEFLCKLTGYGPANPKGFTKHYVYELGKGFRPVEISSSTTDRE